MNCHPLLIAALISLFCLSASAQQNDSIAFDKCGTMQHLKQKLDQNSILRERFEQKKIEFNKIVSTRSYNNTAKLNAAVYIPVVFHIVLDNPNTITDAQIHAQLDTLNKDFFGANGDSSVIPSYFKPLFGKSNIQFCLAQRTPDGEATNGIDRVFTAQPSFDINDGVKHNFSGGVDSWNTDKYYNVWVCSLASNLLGYASFPDDGSPAEQGVVIDYRTLPGSSALNFGEGKTLTHETGHYFNLYHIWGDDNGSCTGTDFVDDTPNQANFTTGCFSGIKTDNCTPGGNGVMYQNYMDYSNDACLVMFTLQQVDRMESALSVYRASLLSSNGCQPVILNNYDVQLRSVNQPSQRICDAVFTPQITIKNRGSQNLTSLLISTSIDNGPITTYPWTGSITTYNTTTINLANLTTSPGNHTLTVYVSNPDNNTDQDRTNDTLQLSFEYSVPVTQVNESFEGNTFPSEGWDVVNSDNAITWQRVSGIAKTGNASVKIANYDYNHVGEKDDLRMPLIQLPNSIDSAFLSFQVAAATYTATNTTNNDWDTLQVLVSSDCGQTYTSVYKKWGKDLVTRPDPITFPFTPASTEWRQDSVNLSNFIGMGNLLITFRNTTGFENNIYLDDINLKLVSVNHNLKEQGFLVTPNPTSGAIAIQFYPQPSNLKGIEIFNDIGQKIAEISIAAGQASNYYSVDLSRYAKGMYTVRAIFTNRVITKKIIKL